MRNRKANNNIYYMPYKQRRTANRANDSFGDEEHPAPRERMMKWIEEFNAKEEMFARRMSQLRYIDRGENNE